MYAFEFLPLFITSSSPPKEKHFTLVANGISSRFFFMYCILWTSPADIVPLCQERLHVILLVSILVDAS